MENEKQAASFMEEELFAHVEKTNTYVSCIREPAHVHVENANTYAPFTADPAYAHVENERTGALNTEVQSCVHVEKSSVHASITEAMISVLAISLKNIARLMVVPGSVKNVECLHQKLHAIYAGHAILMFHQHQESKKNELQASLRNTLSLNSTNGTQP